MLCRINPYQVGKFIACSVLFRGPMSPKDVDQEVLNVQNKGCSPFVEWIAGNIHSSICDVPPPGLPIHGTYLANSTAITQLFDSVEEQFLTMFRRKAFLHWYTSEGMEEAEFTKAQEEMNDVASLYRSFEDERVEGDLESDDDY